MSDQYPPPPPSGGPGPYPTDPQQSGAVPNPANPTPAPSPYPTSGQSAPASYPASGPVPPGSAYPPATPVAGAPYPGAVPPPQPPAPDARPGTDGVALASLIAGVLCTGPIALLLGLLGLRRTGPGKNPGRGLAIGGTVLGGIGTVGWAIVLIVVLAIGGSGRTGTGGDAADSYAEGCADGDMPACDSLYYASEAGSEDRELAETCNGQGDRADYMTCTALQIELDKATSYGDDPELDDLYDECKSGDMAACDELYETAPSADAGSEYKDFGGDCGGVDTGGTDGWCEFYQNQNSADPEDQADAADALEDYSDDSSDEMTYEDWLQLAKNLAAMGGSPEESQSYGDNTVLDVWWDQCTSGMDNTCMTLWLVSAEGTEYRAHAASCGGRGAKPGVCSF